MKQRSTPLAMAGFRPVSNARSRWRLLLVAAVVFSMCTVGAFAQVITGDVLGTVTDSTGATVPNATVLIKNLGTNATRTLVTEANGEFVFNLLPPGQYSLSVEAQGFKTYKIRELAVSAGTRSRYDAQLQIGSAGENIEVTAAAPLLQTDSSSVGNTITEDAVVELPLNGRNITNLVTQQVGVNAGTPGSITQGARPDDRRQSSSVSANGQREYLNANMLDGIDNNERYYGLGGIKPSVDAIQEVRVETNAFSAEIGRSGGAAVTVLTKSGTNQFHGTLYEFFRNDIFDATDYFIQKTSKWRQNQYGGSIGGPIRKDKTFFFFDVEQLRLVQGISSPLQVVPSDAKKQAAASLNCNGGLMPSVFDPGPLAEAFPPGIFPIMDPAACAIAKNLYALYPSANTSITAPNGTVLPAYISNPAKTQNSTTLDARVDHHFSTNDSVFVRYSWNPTDSFFPPYFPASGGVQPAGAGFIANGEFPGTNKTTAQGAQINYTHVFNQSLLMDLRAGFLRLNIDSRTINQGLNSGDKLGIPNVNLSGDVNSSGMPGFHFLDGSGDLGDQIAYPIHNINNSYQLNGDVIYTRGKHNLKFGAAVIRRQINYMQQFAATGWFFFLSPDLMLAGMPAVFVNRQNQYSPEYLRSWEPSMYVQDDWHVRPWLTLNLGIRYDIFTPITDAKNRLTNLDLNPGNCSISDNGSCVPELVVGNTGRVQTDYKDIAPRIGFSAQLGKGYVLRGGFGISYYPGDYASMLTLWNPPYNVPFNCSPASGSCPNGAGFLETGPPLAPAFVDPNIIYSPTAGNIGLVSKQMNFRAAYLEQFNLMLQKELGANVITLGYVGSLGRRQSSSNGTDMNLSAPDSTGTFTLVNGEVPHFYENTLPGVSGISQYANEYTSTYNAMQVSFERRFSKGLMMNANYTWAHGLNNWSGYESGGAPGQWRGNLSYDYGNSDLDIRHRIAVTATYDLPWGKSLKGTAKAFLADWSLSSSGFWQTGLPFTITDSIKPGGAFGDFNSAIRVNVVPGQNPYLGGAMHGFLDPDAFAPAYTGSQTTFTLGNEGINQYYGPHQRQFDMAMYKDFKLTEAVKAQFRAECFNISNTPNFQLKSNNLDLNSGSFGQLTSTTFGTTPRVWQFALKFSF